MHDWRECQALYQSVTSPSHRDDSTLAMIIIIYKYIFGATSVWKCQCVRQTHTAWEIEQNKNIYLPTFYWSTTIRLVETTKQLWLINWNLISSFFQDPWHMTHPYRNKTETTTSRAQAVGQQPRYITTMMPITVIIILLFWCTLNLIMLIIQRRSTKKSGLFKNVCI